MARFESFGMKLYKLNKVILQIKNNVAQFLQGLTSNDLDKPQNTFVNINGRIIATFDQLRISDDEFIILVEERFVDGLLNHIDKFVKLSAVKIERLKKNVYFDLDGNTKLEANDHCIPQKKGRLLITDQVLQVHVSQEEFTLFRLKNNIPVQGIDYTDDFILNVSQDFVSFTKGCFLGQEPIAKVHHRSKPSWKLLVKYEDECTLEEKPKMTSKVVEPQTRRVLGFIFLKND